MNTINSGSFVFHWVEQRENFRPIFIWVQIHEILFGILCVKMLNQAINVFVDLCHSENHIGTRSVSAVDDILIGLDIRLILPRCSATSVNNVR